MKLLIYLSLILISQVSIAQNGISGKITDEQTGEAILFGDVILYKNGVLISGTQSDFKGHYSIGNLDAGLYDMEVVYVGYSSSRIQDIHILQDSMTRLDVALSPGINLECVLIKNYKKPLIERDNTSSGGTINAHDIRNLPTKNINALASPTTSLSTKKKGKIKARGIRSSGTEYYIDGIRVKGHRKIKVESTRVTKSIITQPKRMDLAKKLTATEVNDFADWNFWSTIQETDFIQTSLLWKMNPQQRYSIQLKNNEGFALQGLTVELLDENDKILWQTISDNLGSAQLFAGFIENDMSTTTSIRVTSEGGILYKGNAEIYSSNSQLITIDTPCKQTDALEIAFLLDVSGSMRDEMYYLKAEIEDITSQLSKQFKNMIIRVGLVTFQGHKDEVPTNYQPLTTDVSLVTNSIKSNCGSRHHDEAMDEALRISVDELGWQSNSTKIAFVIGDQQVFSHDKYRSTLRENVKRSAALGIKLVPIGCSGMPKELEYVMRAMSIATGGTYLALTDDSGVGGRHIKPTTNSIDVQSLNDLIFDVITRFTNSTSCESGEPPVASRLKGPHITLNKNANKEEIKYELNIFPNPTDGPFKLKRNAKLNAKQYFLCDLAGRVVKRFDDSTNKAAFDISEFAAGIYFLLCEDENGRYGSSQIIKTSNLNELVFE